MRRLRGLLPSPIKSSSGDESVDSGGGGGVVRLGEMGWYAVGSPGPRVRRKIEIRKVIIRCIRL
jgi:hypothetical protein